MPDRLVWYVGDRDPSISETITIAGVPVDLTSKSVKLKMRPVGSSTLKVDAAAQIVNPPGTDGQVRYDWQAVDVNAAGTYIAWWEVTSAGPKVQAVHETVLEFRAHAASGWCELADVKTQLGIAGEDRDAMILDAIAAASEALNARCQHEIAPKVANTLRLFPFPTGLREPILDMKPYDLRSATLVQLHPESTPVTLISDVDYTLLPIGGNRVTGAYQLLQLARSGWTTSSYSGAFGSVRLAITGNWGCWDTSEVPADVKRACVLTVGTWIDKAMGEYGMDSLETPRASLPGLFTGYSIPNAAVQILDKARLIRQPILG